MKAEELAVAVVEEQRSEVPRCRPITVKMFGKQHVLLESFPKHLSTDMMTLVECFRRDKPFKLSAERISTVESALATIGSSLPAVKAHIEQLRLAASDQFDANHYYDETRVAAYTAEFKDVQHKHSARCLYVLPDLVQSCVLDIGCGSGLSTERIASTAKSSFIVGIDASEAMLQAATQQQRRLESGALATVFADFVLCDFNATQPFRSGVFDNASSTSAVHYVKRDRRDRFLEDVARCVTGDFAFQLFPKDGARELPTFLSKDPSLYSSIFIDKPHHKDERYYLFYSREEQRVRRSLCECQVFATEVLSSPQSHRCLLSFPRREGILEEGHLEWLQREHDRWLRREERLQRRQSMLDEQGQDNAQAQKVTKVES
eukprot:gene11079-7884_t